MVDSSILQKFITEDLESDSEFTYHLFDIFQKYIEEFNAIDGKTVDVSFETIANQAHRLRSSCTSFGAEPLNKALCELELEANKKNKDIVLNRLMEAQKIALETLSVLNRDIDDFFTKEKDCA